MKYKLIIGLLFIVLCVSANFAQTEITIKKKSSMKMEGLPEMPKMPGMKNPLDEMNNRTSTVYIKGSRMRNDAVYKQPGMKESITQTIIFQTDKKQFISFSNKKKKYFVDSTVPPVSASVKNATKGGIVTVTGSVTDTGERMKLFGFNARHLKETITMTPSKNACTQYTIQVEIDGWYADYDEFLCPITRPKQEFQTDKNCYDEFDFQNKGGIGGISLKEIKKIRMQGITIITEEEATEILKTPLADSLFEPPANYKLANTLKEVEDDSPDN